MTKNTTPLTYNIYSKSCPARAFFDRLADHWSLLILSLLRKEAFRFNQIKREVEGISQKVLSQKLKQLERDGLIIRTAFATVPVTVEYCLTDLGHDFAKTIEQFACWAEQNIQQVKQAQKVYDDSNS
jgi:DNA-binding HxlR family transcriptional regulator